MRFFLTCICTAGLLVSCTGAWALTVNPLTVVAVSGERVATWTYQWQCDQYAYCLGAPVELRAADGTLLGAITKLDCTAQGDPALFLDFSVHAFVEGDFTFDTGDLLFSTIDNPVAFATAATTLTADGNGATFTGNFAGSKAYQATYNGGTAFANLDGFLVSSATTSATQEERLPAAGTIPIGVPVSSMRAQWDFHLTAEDDASGTSRYEIQESPIPDASTLVLALAGVAPLTGCLVRKRRTL